MVSNGARLADLAEFAVRNFVEWCFRPRTVPFAFLGAGVMLMLARLAAGMLVSGELHSPDLNISLSVDVSSAADMLNDVGFLFGLGLAAVGATLAVIGWFGDRAADDRRRVIVIEQRGLTAALGSPLTKAVPRSIRGRRDDLVLDLTSFQQDQRLSDPDAAMRKTADIRRDLDSRASGIAREDLTIVYGGLAAVPLTFLAGFLIDDEFEVVAMDWDRRLQRWRRLNSSDDRERFEICGLETVVTEAYEVAVAVSASYSVNLPGIRRTLGDDVPIIELRLPVGGPNCHWSATKQDALADQFLDVARRLGGLGVQQVHLFVAAPNSLAFRLGRAYDQRNLPPAQIYQYEQSEKPPFPWAVILPTHGQAFPALV